MESYILSTILVFSLLAFCFLFLCYILFLLEPYADEKPGIPSNIPVTRSGWRQIPQTTNQQINSLSLPTNTREEFAPNINEIRRENYLINIINDEFNHLNDIYNQQISQTTTTASASLYPFRVYETSYIQENIETTPENQNTKEEIISKLEPKQESRFINVRYGKDLNV